MANLSEDATWVDGIYQLEDTDPVSGGTPNLPLGDGMDNVPHQQLAKRTSWLKGQVDALLQAVVAASTTVAGIVRLSNAVDSSSTALAATPSAVKAAYDNAELRVPNNRLVATSGLATGGGPLDADRTISVPIATQAEAEAGTANDKAMTPLRAAQLLDLAQGKGGYKAALIFAGNQTLTAADAGKCYIYDGTSAVTVTLPAIADTPVGSTFEFVNTGTANMTVQRAGSDQIDSGSTAVASIVIPPNQSLKLIRATGASLWHPVSVTAAGLATSFASNLAENGWQRLPSGLIMQWGIITQVTSSNGFTATVTLPLSFPNEILGLLGNLRVSSVVNGAASVNLFPTSLSQITVSLDHANGTEGTGLSRSVFWQAIGH